MKLYIDTSNSEKIIVGLNGELHETDSRKEKAQALLGFIVDLLEKRGKTIKDIDEIEINPGPGSFTGLRVGLAVANTLAAELGVKLNGKTPGARSIKLIYN